MAEELRSLMFRGRTVRGVGLYSKMVIPGRSDLPSAPANWPIRLQPGSLNVLIEEYPNGFKPPCGRTEGVYRLDDQSFRCAFFIPGDHIANNELMYQGEPSPAQVWRAKLDVPDKALSINCWVLRRMGSNVGSGLAGNVLEVVSDKHLRSEFDLYGDDQEVALTIFAGVVD